MLHQFHTIWVQYTIDISVYLFSYELKNTYLDHTGEAWVHSLNKIQSSCRIVFNISCHIQPRYIESMVFIFYIKIIFKPHTRRNKIDNNTSNWVNISNLFAWMVYFAELHADSFVISYPELFWKSITFLMIGSEIKMNHYDTGYIEYQWYVMMKIFVVLVRNLLYTRTGFDSHPVLAEHGMVPRSLVRYNRISWLYDTLLYWVHMATLPERV